MKAVLYCRVSSKEQEREGYSIPAQRKLLVSYANKNGLKVAKEFTDVESAKSSGRTQFKNMVVFLKANSDVRAVLVEKTDRLYRNFKDYVLLEELDLHVHLVKENEIISKDSKSHAKLVHGFKLVLSKNYIDNLSEEVKKGLKEKAEQGLFPALAPLGYINVRETGLIVTEPETASLVARAFELMASGQWSLSMLTKKLHVLRLRTRKGNKLQKSSLAHMLKNPFYYGVFLWKGRQYPGQHDPLITKQLFDAANAAMTGRGHPAKPRLNGFAYNNLAMCGICGCRVIGERKKGRYVYYHCTHSKGRHPGVPYSPEAKFVQLFDHSVERVTISDDTLFWLQDVLEDSLDDQTRHIESRAKLLTRQKSVLENRLSKLYDILCDGKLAIESFSMKETEYKNELARVLSAQKECEQDILIEAKDGLEILELANRLYPTYLSMDHSNRAKLLRLVASNYVLEDGTIRATYRTPFNLFMNLPPRIKKLPRLDSNQRPAD